AAGYAAAVLPAIPTPEPESQQAARIAWMADQLHRLERRYRLILFVCSLLDWPWLRQAYQQRPEVEEPADFYAPLATYPVDTPTLTFFLNELPFVTALYERGRRELTPDDNLSIDGVKEMVLHARDRLRETLPRVAERLTPHLLGRYFRY